MSVDELLPHWLIEGSIDRRGRERAARLARLELKDPDTPYGQAMKAIADAHGEAAQVYERRLAELDEKEEHEATE